MKYFDGQKAKKGDKCIAGTWGSCVILKISRKYHIATIQNILTKETWEIHSLDSFDLEERK